MPRVGYIYPAGGRQGATFQVTLGGQFLNGATNVYISGEGVEGFVVEYNRPMAQNEFNQLRDKLRELQEKRAAARREPGSTNVWTTADEQLFAETRDRILKNPPNRQVGPALAETVVVQLTVASNAAPGERELRVRAAAGLSNPRAFWIGQLPEFSKPIARTANPELDRLRRQFRVASNSPPTRADMRVSLPATINGQIMPGAVDRFRFTARKGDHVVAQVRARDLIPYLADAVPGWFQATLAIYDARGNELAYDDDDAFQPDPALHCEIPQDGEYRVEIKDAIYRGREDFVYRITLGELPFVRNIFPLGGSAGAPACVAVSGWNLPPTNIIVDCANQTAGIHPLTGINPVWLASTREFAMDSLPEITEQEPNNSTTNAQSVTLPVMVNGRVASPDDVDVFQFRGRAGEQVVAEVQARRLGSPLDSVLQLLDDHGRTVAFNDDYEDKADGLNTHHADSYLRATLPSDGTFAVELRDAQHQGGADYAYRLRISPPRPDFELRVVPSSINLRSGVNVPLTIYALRRDGLTNAIRLNLEDAPARFNLSGAEIPANADKVRLTLAGSINPRSQPFVLDIVGRTTVAGRELVHRATPAEDMMQAFAYRHLVPVQELDVLVLGGSFGRNTIGILGTNGVTLRPGGTADVRVNAPPNFFRDRFPPELDEPPDGVSIESVTPSGTGPVIRLRCDATKAKPGLKGNLIVNVFPGRPRLAANARAATANRRPPPIGVLPAIPFEIVPGN